MATNKKKVTENAVTEVNLESTVRDIPIMADSLPGNSEIENAETPFDSINSTVTSVTPVTTCNDAPYIGNSPAAASVTVVTGGFSVNDLINEAIDPNEEPPTEPDQPKINRPCYAVYDERVILSGAHGGTRMSGVY